MRRLFGLLFSLFSSFCLAQVSVTIDLQPSGARAPVNVTGANCQAGQYLAPVQLTWTPGPACQVEVLPYGIAPGTRLALASWDDQSTTSAISIPVPASNLTRFARIGYEYQVTTEAQPPSAASVTPGGWFASGAKATVQATANPNQLFLYWAISSGCASVAKPQPLIIECQVDRPVTLAATFRATTAPIPGRYTVTAIPALSAMAGGALTASGAVAAYVERAGGRSVYLWQPEKPNSAMGLAAEIVSLSNRTATWVVRINDAGRLAYSVTPLYKMAIWTPSAPGSVTGTEANLADTSNLIAGYPGGFNRFGQIAAMLNSGSAGLWTPASAGGTGGTTFKDARFDAVQGLNDFGQVLSESPSGGSTPPLGFTVFTPTAANSAAGTFASVTPLGATSTSTHAINAGGMVAGTYCTTPVGMACQARAFLWQPSSPNTGTGAAIDIAPPPGFPGVSSIAVMNSAGDMAGSLVVNSYQTTPFLRTGGVFYDLNQIPGVPILSQALGLNDAGQILLTNGNSQGLLLLTPQPAAPPPGANAVPVTISASSPGIGFAVTGAGCQPGDYNAPSTLQWTPGASCQVRWLGVEFSGHSQRRVFTGWSDGPTANPRTFAVPVSATIYTASFSDEVYVTTVAEPPQGGTASGSGWYPVNSSVTIVAAAAPGYRFGYWENLTYLDGATTHVTVDSLHTNLRAFFALTTPLPYTYTVTTISGVGEGNGRLNNFGQIVSGRNGSAPNVMLWTPAQPNGTAGTITGLSGFAFEGRADPLPMLYLNDRGQFTATHPSLSAQLWSPSTPNGTQGAISTVSVPAGASPFTPRHINAYGQIFASMPSNQGFWTPTIANGATGSLNVLPGNHMYFYSANDRGQVLVDERNFANAVALFSPTRPNAAAGTFATINLPYPPLYWGGHAMNARGAVVVTATVVDNGGAANYRPLLWTPSVDNGTTGATQLLPIPAGFSGVSPLFLNNRNEVAGLAYSPNRNGPVPFVFTQGKMFAIEGVPGLPGGGWPLGFNDSGQLLLSSLQAGVLYLLTPQAGTGACPVTTSLLQETVGPAGGRVTISITSAASCTWSAAVSDPWLVPNGSTAGTGNGTLSVDVPGNSTGAARTGYVTINGTTFTIRQSLLPVVSFYPASLRIVVGANGVTGPQDVQIRTSGTGVVTGSAYTIYPPELKATLAQASLPGSMTVSFTKGATAPLSGVYQVTVGLNGADQPSLSLPVTIEVQPAGTATKPPFGSLDTPVVNAGALSGGVAVTGWAMDDIGVEKVEIWRDRVGNEQVYPNGKVYIGVGTFVQDARSDIEGLFPTLPQNRRAGWGYMMLSNVLPNPGGAPGNGTYTLEAIAVDREGNSASLGRRVITVNNGASKKPFGALDAPGAGATVSGSAYGSSGWVLTPR
ncbi:MAG TPA: BACON domain-containing protein, partial [Paludibaculum sp.]